MRLLSRITGVVITYLPLLMLRIGKAAPSPEVATGKVTARCSIVAGKFSIEVQKFEGFQAL